MRSAAGSPPACSASISTQSSGGEPPSEVPPSLTEPPSPPAPPDDVAAAASVSRSRRHRLAAGSESCRPMLPSYRDSLPRHDRDATGTREQDATNQCQTDEFVHLPYFLSMSKDRIWSLPHGNIPATCLKYSTKRAFCQVLLATILRRRTSEYWLIYWWFLKTTRESQSHARAKMGFQREVMLILNKIWGKKKVLGRGWVLFNKNIWRVLTEG